MWVFSVLKRTHLLSNFLGFTRYELKNHLGNVLAVVSDRKLGISDPSNASYLYYIPEAVNLYDYYPFGSLNRFYMRALIFILGGFVLLSCNDKPPKNAHGNIEIELTDSVILMWNIDSSNLIENEGYYEVINNYGEYRSLLIELIANDEETDAWFCDNYQMKVGDFAFMTLRRKEGIPNFEVFGMQWDVLDNNCEDTAIVFRYINSNREKCQGQIRDYLNQKKE